MSQAVDCEFTISGDGPPLFLIHGIGAARDTWRFVLPELEKHFTVVTYDLRGHGSSPAGNEKFSLDELVADLERVREKTGFEQAHFSGHSLGGMIGPAYVRAFPERVLSLGLLSTAAFRTTEDSQNVLAVVNAMESKGVAQILETLVDRWYTDDFIASHPEVIDRRLEQVINTDEQIFLNVFRIYAETEMSPWLHEITAPSLVLTGENDGGCNPRLNKQIANSLVDSKLVILPNYKHSILLEAGETVARETIEFIKNLPSA